MNNTIFGRMLTDYAYLDSFSIVTYIESGKSYDDIYESLLQARQSGLDFSASINSSKNGTTGCLYVKNTLIFIKTADISRLRACLHGTMSVDYCTSIAYILSPACVFNLVAGYAVNKVYCERDELLIGKIFIKAGKSNGYIFVSPEIKEISISNGTTKPVLIISAYGRRYKRSARPTKTHLNTSGLVVRGGSGIFLKSLHTSSVKSKRVCNKKAKVSLSPDSKNSKSGKNISHAFVRSEYMCRSGFMATKDFALKKIFDAMEEAGSSVRFEMWNFQLDPRYNFDEKDDNLIQINCEIKRMKEILKYEKICITGSDYERNILLDGLKSVLDEEFSLSLNEVYSEKGKLRFLIINDKEHDFENVYKHTKQLRTQHVTIQRLHDSDDFHKQMKACLRSLCVQNDLFSKKLTLIKEWPADIMSFIYGDIDGDIYSMTISDDRHIKIKRYRANSYSAVREYLRSMQAEKFMAMKDNSGHVYALRDTGQPAIPPVRPDISDYNNKCQVTKDKIYAMFNFSWSIIDNSFYYISGYSVKENRSPKSYPHVYEIHPVGHAILPSPETVFSLVNVGFVRNDQKSAVVPWGFKYLREYISTLSD